MKKLIVITIIGLFFGVAVAPSITADVKEQEIIETKNELEQQEQRLQELIDGILSYVERIYGPLPDEDCGCYDANTTEWNNPVLCTLLYPIWILSVALLLLFSLYDFNTFIEELGEELNCFWS